MQSQWIVDKHLEPLILPLAIALGVFIVLILSRSLIFRVASRKSRDSSSFWSVVHPVIYGPSLFWCVAFAIHLGIDLSNLPERQGKVLYQILHIALIISFTLVAANLAAQLVRRLVRAAHRDLPVSGLAIAIVKATVFGLGLVASLAAIGIPIGPFLGALGVGGIGVALALKDTLENVFAGVYLITDRTVQVGDAVKTDGGLEGVVEDISWRTTRIRTLANNIIVIPNGKLAQSALTNYSLPDGCLAVYFPVTVSNLEDPQKIEMLLNSIIKAGSEDITGLLTHPEPTIRLEGLGGDGNHHFTIKVFVGEFLAQGFVRHEVLKRIWQKFKTEGVQFSTPTISAQIINKT